MTSRDWEWKQDWERDERKINAQNSLELHEIFSYVLDTLHSFVLLKIDSAYVIKCWVCCLIRRELVVWGRFGLQTLKIISSKKEIRIFNLYFICYNKISGIHIHKPNLTYFIKFYYSLMEIKVFDGVAMRQPSNILNAVRKLIGLLAGGRYQSAEILTRNTHTQIRRSQVEICSYISVRFFWILYCWLEFWACSYTICQNSFIEIVVLHFTIVIK